MLVELLAHCLQNYSGIWENSLSSLAQTSAEKRVAALYFRHFPWKTHRSCPCCSAKPWYLLKRIMQLAAQSGITQGNPSSPFYRQLPKFLNSSQRGFPQSTSRSELQAGLRFDPSDLWPWQCSSRCISGLNSGSFLLEMYPNSPPKPRHSRKNAVTPGKWFTAYSCY